MNGVFSDSDGKYEERKIMNLILEVKFEVPGRIQGEVSTSWWTDQFEAQERTSDI